MNAINTDTFDLAPVDPPETQTPAAIVALVETIQACEPISESAIAKAIGTNKQNFSHAKTGYRGKSLTPEQWRNLQALANGQTVTQVAQEPIRCTATTDMLDTIEQPAPAEEPTIEVQGEGEPVVEPAVVEPTAEQSDAEPVADDAGDVGDSLEADEPRYRIAFVSNKESAVTQVSEGTWKDLGDLLKSPKIGLKDGPGWLPALIEPGPRTKARVTGVQLLVLDLEAETTQDQATKIKTAIGPEPPSIAEFASEIELHGWRAYLHTSHSHLDPEIRPTDVEHPRYRVVLALSRTLEPDELDLFGPHIAARLGVGDCTDRGSYEVNRLFYLPRCPAERLDRFKFVAIEGDPIDVDSVLAQVRREAEAIRRAQEQRQQRTAGKRGEVIATFNGAHDVGAVLEQHGYIRKRGARWLHPDSSTGEPGVRLLPDSDPPRIFSSHGCCPLNDGHAHDAFDCWRILSGYGDDFRAAVREAARLMGMDRKEKPKADMDAFLDRLREQPSAAQEANGDAEPQEATDPPPRGSKASEGDSAAQSGDQAEETKKRWSLIPVGDLLDPPEPLTWIVKDYLMPSTLVQVFGDPASGKSLLTLDWAASVATGRDWREREIKQAPVVYLAGEGHFGIRRRLKAWAMHNDAEAALRGAPMVVSSGGTGLGREEDLTRVVHEIDAFGNSYGAPALIVVDTVHRHFDGEENSSDDWASFLKAMDALMARYGATILLVHHSGHGDKTRSRGSSAIRGAMDSEYCLINEQGIRTLTTTKMKDAPSPPPCSFTLEQITLPWMTADGEAETSVVLVESDSHSDGWRKSSVSQTQRLAFETLLEAIDENGFAPPDHVAESLPNDARIVSLENWRRAFYARHMGDSPDAKKKAFQRARMDLAKLGGIGHREDCYWPAPGCGGVSELQGILNARSLLAGLEDAKNG